MSRITKLTSFGLPALVGLGVAWVGIRVINNKQKIETRLIELENQLKGNSFSKI